MQIKRPPTIRLKQIGARMLRAVSNGRGVATSNRTKTSLLTD